MSNFTTTLKAPKSTKAAGRTYTKTAEVDSRFLLGGNIVWADGALHSIGGVGVRGEGTVHYRAYNMVTDTYVFLMFVQGARVSEYDAL
jgi:hypothetical protein